MEFSVWGFPVLKFNFENPEKALEDILKYANEERLNEMDTPIVMMAGKMYLTLTTYEEVMSTMEELE